MSKYDKFLGYLDYFRQVGKGELKGYVDNSWELKYDQEMLDFHECLYEDGILDPEYLPKLRAAGVCLMDHNRMAERIETADLDLLISLLHYFLRAEHFGDGAWIKAIDDKIFYKILLRLRELTKNE